MLTYRIIKSNQKAKIIATNEEGLSIITSDIADINKMHQVGMVTEAALYDFVDLHEQINKQKT